MWRQVVGELDRLGVVSKLDTAVLATYCQSWARWRQLQAQLDAEGDAADFHIRVAARQEANALRLLASELGLTPAARARLPIVAEPEGPLTGGIR